ncbi:hypothetical protein [Amycolatopsis sp. lyj-108]
MAERQQLLALTYAHRWNRRPISQPAAFNIIPGAGEYVSFPRP